MRFISLLTAGLLASSAVAFPTHEDQGNQGGSDISDLTRKAVGAPAKAATTVTKGKSSYTPAELQDLATGDKFYKAALKEVGATKEKAPKLRRTPVFGSAAKKLGEFGTAVLNHYSGANLPNNVVFVRQHEAAWVDTTNSYIGTVGLASCACLVYSAGSRVVLAHIFPAAPGIQTGAPAGHGSTYVSMANQLQGFQTAMTQAGLNGREAGGRWVFSQPVQGGQAKFADHQQVVTWVTGFAPGATVTEVPFQWSETGGSYREQSDLIPEGKGVVFAYHSKIYVQGIKTLQ